MKKILSVMLCALVLSLQGCFVAGAAAGAAAVAVIYDHRNVDSILTDQKIVRRINQKIQDDASLDESHVNVTCFGQVVLLTGETNTTDQRKTVEALAKSTRYVKRVYNAITVGTPTSRLTHATDSWITTKIKTEILATKGLQAASIKVVTENGTVYLLGVVSHQQADMLTDIVKHTSGVERVVKIFQYDDSLSKNESEAKPELAVTEASSDSDNASSGAKAQGTDDLEPLIPS